MAWIGKDSYGVFLYKDKPRWDEVGEEWTDDNPSQSVLCLDEEEVEQFLGYELKDRELILV